MLTQIINDAHNRLRRYADEIGRAKCILKSSISHEHFSALHDEIANNIAVRSSRTRSRLQRKLNQISPTAKKNPQRVVNLSSRQLSPTESSILSRGLKFNSADANYIDFLGNLESILQSSPIPEEARADIRSIAASQLRNNNPSHPTTVEEKRAITSLKNDPNITIVPADKGGATVIMDKEDYKAKALQQLSDAETYATVTTDPTPKQTRAIQKTLDRLVREETLPAPTARKLSPKETSIARAYGLPKIHKTGNPLRMIVSLVGSPTYNLSKWMFTHLKPIVADSEHSISNSLEFLECLKHITIAPDECMVSFDVVSLFTSISLGLARETIIHILAQVRSGALIGQRTCWLMT